MRDEGARAVPRLPDGGMLPRFDRPRVVRSDAVRAILWLPVACLLLLRSVEPDAPRAWFAVASSASAECGLDTERGEVPCECGELSGQLRQLLDLPISLNRAAVVDLEAISGIGPARARSIVAFREAEGPFRDVLELERVPGIGPATFRAVRESLFVGPEDPACAVSLELLVAQRVDGI